MEAAATQHDYVLLGQRFAAAYTASIRFLFLWRTYARHGKELSTFDVRQLQDTGISRLDAENLIQHPFRRAWEEAFSVDADSASRPSTASAAVA